MADVSGASLYSQLDESISGCFRLVSIEAGAPGSLLSCNLAYDSFSRCSVSYEALSYVWGDTQATKPILLCTKSFQVTENLYSALQHLRYRDQSRVLWIDAICINQADIEERSQQVRNMGQIYKNCHRVIVWLCESTPSTEFGVEFLYEVCDDLDSKGISYKNVNVIEDVEDTTFLQAAENFLTPEHGIEWQAVCLLLLKPWWERAWVFQEFVIAPAAVIAIGETIIDWELFYVVQALLKIMNSTIREGLGLENLLFSLPDVGGLLEARLDRMVYPAPKDTLSVQDRIRSTYFTFLLCCQRQKKCQDARDKVFSILGLADAGVGHAIQPDYSRTTQWIYGLAVKSYIEVYRDLNILCYCMPSNPCTPYPSWCPDWAGGQPRSVLGGTPHISGYAASAGSSALVRFSEDFTTIWLTGYQIDVVQYICVQESDVVFAWSEDEKSTKCNWNLQSIANSAARRYNQVPARSQGTARTETCFKSPENDSALEILLDTLIAGRLSSGGFGPRTASQLVKDPDTKEEWPPNRAEYFEDVITQTSGRTLIFSRGGFLGLASLETQPGDLIFILRGCGVPVILRKCNDSAYIWIADSYIHGVMNGEAMTGLENGLYQEESIMLR